MDDNFVGYRIAKSYDIISRQWIAALCKFYGDIIYLVEDYAVFAVGLFCYADRSVRISDAVICCHGMAGR